MNLKEQFERAKSMLLNDPDICKENRTLFTEFFQFEEYKLKRIRGKPSLDDNSHKTLLNYCSRLRTVNRWFGNQPWRSLTKADIQRVYDTIEDGKILTQKGASLKDKRSYYKLIIRGKPFEMAGKRELVKEVMQFTTLNASDEVRFITEESFRRVVDTVRRPDHRLFLWLCWDIGENARSILQLRKRDCVQRRNDQLNEIEYAISLQRDILKRSRRPRTELTNYRETASQLDLHLKALAEENFLFRFEAAAAYKMLQTAAEKAKVRCQPAGQHVTLKDLRSSMACDLLSKGWSRDEVNARLGHAPSSDEIDRYLNYLAIDRQRPKKKIHDNQISVLMSDLAQARNREKLTLHRYEELQHSNAAQAAYLNEVAELQAKIALVEIHRFQGKLSEQEFAQTLMEHYNALVLLMNDSSKPSTATSRFATSSSV